MTIPSRIKIHPVDHRSEETTKGSRNGCCREENGYTDTEFRPLIPAREIVAGPREETSFSKTKKPLAGLSKALYISRRKFYPCGHESRPIKNEAHHCHTDAPEDPVWFVNCEH